MDLLLGSLVLSFLLLFAGTALLFFGTLFLVTWTPCVMLATIFDGLLNVVDFMRRKINA